jgi:zinc and cadmium transporter
MPAERKPMTDLILYSLIGGVFSLIGGLILLWNTELSKKIITPLLAFAAGSFLAASFLDILPEALESVEDPHPVLMWVLGGFSLFFILERVFMRYFHTHAEGKHDHADHTESLPFLLILGDSLHNFLDGIVIALAYLANPVLGLTTTLAVAAHEIPQEIGDFSILLNQGWSKAKIVAINIFQSILTVVGVVIGYYAGMSLEAYLPYLLAGVAGIFLYLSASDIIPEIHHHGGHKSLYAIVIPFVASIILIGYLVEFAHSL